MKERFIVTTYNPNIVGSAPFEAGMIETAYYIGNGNFGFNKIEANLFDEYADAKYIIEINNIDYAQIEKVFIF